MSNKPTQAMTEVRLLDMIIRAVNLAIWQRDKKTTKRGMQLACSIHSSRMTPRYAKWPLKVNKLYQWLILPGNRQLWKKTPKALPYERSTKQYHEWRMACLDRDNWKCQHCDKTKELNIHHKKAYKDYKELRLDVDNGITLCQLCHIREHKRLRHG